MKRVKCSAILYSLPKTTQPRPQVFSVNCSIIWQICCTIGVISFTYRKIFPNLVDSSWLWWIMCGILAIRNGELFWMNNNCIFYWRFSRENERQTNWPTILLCLWSIALDQAAWEKKSVSYCKKNRVYSMEKNERNEMIKFQAHQRDFNLWNMVKGLYLQVVSQIQST